MKNSQTVNKPLAIGDLVRKKYGLMTTPSLNSTNWKKIGIIVGMNAGIAKVCWGSYGTFQTPTHTLELLTSS